MADLKIADGFTLPADAVTETVGILAQRGAGKSNAAVVLAEEMYDAGLPWVAVDPKGDWWGIRSSADGKGPGLPLPVFGGLHGDVPLEEGAGRLVADLLVEENLTAVLDVSDFTKGQRRRFLVDFFDRLYRRHRADPHARHVFLEEAHEYIPQQVMRDTADLKEAAARIVLQGRSFGLGSTSLSQRSARLHKDVLTQIGTLVAMRTTAPQDRSAILAWVEEHDVGKELVASLPGLASGEAWIWSPSFLGATERIRWRQRRTFDSGATPKAGQTRRVPATLADVDLAAIKEQMAETIEKAKAEDPKELRKRLAQLERQLAQRPTETTVETVVERVEIPVPMLDEQLVARLEAALGQAGELGRTILDVTDGVLAGLQQARTLATGAQQKLARLPERQPAVARPAPQERPQRAAQPRPAPAGDSTIGGGAPMKVLTVLGHNPTCPKARVAMLAGIGQKKSTLRNALSELRTAGYITGTDPLHITEAGLAALGDIDPLPTGAELLGHWRRELNPSEQTCLDVLIARWPDEVPRAVLAAEADLDPEKSTLRNAMSRLRVLGLASGWRANDDFMESIR